MSVTDKHRRVQNRIECENGKLFCKWHLENGMPILEGENGIITMSGIYSQIAHPKPDKRSGRPQKLRTK